MSAAASSWMSVSASISSSSVCGPKRALSSCDAARAGTAAARRARPRRRPARTSGSRRARSTAESTSAWPAAWRRWLPGRCSRPARAQPRHRHSSASAARLSIASRLSSARTRSGEARQQEVDPRVAARDQRVGEAERADDAVGVGADLVDALQAEAENSLRPSISTQVMRRQRDQPPAAGDDGPVGDARQPAAGRSGWRAGSSCVGCRCACGMGGGSVVLQWREAAAARASQQRLDRRRQAAVRLDGRRREAAAARAAGLQRDQGLGMAHGAGHAVDHRHRQPALQRCAPGRPAARRPARSRRRRPRRRQRSASASSALRRGRPARAPMSASGSSSARMLASRPPRP